MRTYLGIALLLLAITIAGGALEEQLTQTLADRYISAAEEMRVLAEKQDWQRATEIAEGYVTSWTETKPWLQILINHDDIDDVSLALVRLQAAVAARDQGQCYEICAELRENAGHIHHRDAFTWGNVL